MKNYQNRANVVRFLSWWKAKIASGEYTVEHALGLLKAGRTIKYINNKDRLGLIQALEAEYELADVQA